MWARLSVYLFHHSLRILQFFLFLSLLFWFSRYSFFFFHLSFCASLFFSTSLVSSYNLPEHHLHQIQSKHIIFITIICRLLQFKSEKSLKKTIFENFIRTLLVLSTAAIAILAPYFGEVLGAVGGLTDSLQAFVLPPLICYSMHSKNILRFSSGKQLFYIFVFVWGVCTMSFTVIRLTSLIWCAKTFLHLSIHNNAFFAYVHCDWICASHDNRWFCVDIETIIFVKLCSTLLIW